MKKTIIFFFIFALISIPTLSQELRPFTPIKKKPPALKALPPVSQSVKSPESLPGEIITKSVDAISGAWNTQEFQNFVSDRFYNKSNLVDAMNTNTVKDAKLKVMNTNGANVLKQVVVPDPQGGELRISTVSVTMETRVEFNDPKNGFISAPGKNEMILEVIEKIK